MKSHSFFYVLLMAALTLSSCCSRKSAQNATPEEKPRMVATPQVIIYKTVKDYLQYVPVMLSEDKKTVVSYPAPQDIFYKGEFAYPVKLENGYLLDRRGIGPGCAFMKLTYEEYSRLEHTPSAAEIMGMILDDNPLEIMYRCGPQHNYKNLVEELNEIILKEEENKFVRLK